MGVDKSDFRKYVEDLHNDYLQGINNYPQTLNNSYKILSNWTSNPKNYQRLLGNKDEGVTFTVDSVSVTEDDVDMMVSDDKSTNKGNYMATKKFYNCNEMGYTSRNCTKKNKKTAATYGSTADKPTDAKEIWTTERSPDRKTGTISLMAKFKKGDFHDGGFG